MNGELILGDCLEVMKKYPDNHFDLVLTDPPYGMSYQSAWRENKHASIEGDAELSWFPEFSHQIFRMLKNNSHIYLFCNEYSFCDFRNSIIEAGFTVKRLLVWIKNNHTSGDLYGDYGNKTEYILFAHKGRRLLNANRDTNVIDYRRVNCDSHPTAKPVSIMEYLMEKSSNEGDLILDPFAGSGTTAIAAHNCNRRYVLIEKEPEYYELAKKRIETHESQLRLF